MIVNHWQDIRAWMERLSGVDPDPQFAWTKAQEIYNAGIAAGLTPSQDWGHYVKRWEDSKWEDPGKDPADDGRPTLQQWKDAQRQLHEQQLALDAEARRKRDAGE